jgi:hypothetical protein
MTSRQEQTRYEQWKSRLYLLCAKVSKHSSSYAHWSDSRKNCHKIRLVCLWFWKVCQTSLLSKKLATFSIIWYSSLSLSLPLPKSQTTSIKLWQSLRKTPKKYLGSSVFEFYESDRIRHSFYRMHIFPDLQFLGIDFLEDLEFGKIRKKYPYYTLYFRSIQNMVQP